MFPAGPLIFSHGSHRVGYFFCSGFVGFLLCVPTARYVHDIERTDEAVLRRWIKTESSGTCCSLVRKIVPFLLA